MTRSCRRGAHPNERFRKPLPGMVLHQNGSSHESVPGCQWDLIVTLDDATSELYSVFFVEEEGTLSSFGGCKTSSRRGLFSSLYTDRASHYWYTEEAGGRVDKTRLMQVHRALQQLRITLIAAYSLEVRWRSERVFRTLQDRLPKEWALAGTTLMTAANRYLTEQFLSAYNLRFAVSAAEAGTAFVPWSGTPLAEILRVHEEVSSPTTPWCGIRVSSADSPSSTPIPLCDGHGASARMSRWHAGGVSWPRCLARYRADGRLIEAVSPCPGRRNLSHRSGDRAIVDPRPIVRTNTSAQR